MKTCEVVDCEEEAEFLNKEGVSLCVEHLSFDMEETGNDWDCYTVLWVDRKVKDETKFNEGAWLVCAK